MTIEPLRHIPLEGASNLRDIGGYATEDGKRVRWGVVYRSGGISRFSDADWLWVVERKISAVCDLRSDAERLLAPTCWRGGDHTRHVGAAYSADLLFGPLLERDGSAGIGEMGNSLYPLFPKLLAPSFKEMFHTLCKSHVPFIVHCSAGQDRTGVAIGLLLSALGVPRRTILEDYHLSTSLRRPENELDRESMAHLVDHNIVARFYVSTYKRRGAKAFQPRRLVNRQGGPLLADAFAAIDAEWGSIPNYLDRELGVGTNEIRQLKDICLT